jgi:hypothetical protein
VTNCTDEDVAVLDSEEDKRLVGTVPLSGLSLKLLEYSCMVCMADVLRCEVFARGKRACSYFVCVWLCWYVLCVYVCVCVCVSTCMYMYVCSVFLVLCTYIYITIY